MLLTFTPLCFNLGAAAEAARFSADDMQLMAAFLDGGQALRGQQAGGRPQEAEAAPAHAASLPPMPARREMPGSGLGAGQAELSARPFNSTQSESTLCLPRGLRCGTPAGAAAASPAAHRCAEAVHSAHAPIEWGLAGGGGDEVAVHPHSRLHVDDAIASLRACSAWSPRAAAGLFSPRYTGRGTGGGEL